MCVVKMWNRVSTTVGHMDQMLDHRQKTENRKWFGLRLDYDEEIVEREIDLFVGDYVTFMLWVRMGEWEWVTQSVSQPKNIIQEKLRIHFNRFNQLF